MAVSISTNDYEIILFAWAGRTMIGKIWSNVPTSDIGSGTIIGTFSPSDYYMIYNPCEIVFDIDVPAQGSADLTWELKPYFYKALVADSGVKHAAFAFPKDLVALSNIGGTTINANIIAAYRELVD